MAAPSVDAPLDEGLTGYCGSRLEQHTQGIYAALRLSNFPEDLRA